MRIQIIGAAGAGKSTLGRRLSDRLGVPLLEADRYLWADGDFRCMRHVEERRAMLRSDLSSYPDFVIAGSVHSWDADALRNVDLLVLLRLDDAPRIDRLMRREERRYGARCMEGGDHYQETLAFIDWARTYLTAGESESNSLATHARLLSEATCPCLVLDASRSVDDLANLVLGKVVGWITRGERA